MRLAGPAWDRLDRRFRLSRFFRGVGPEGEPVVLDRSRVFVLPTGPGLLFGGLLLAMLLGAMNYQNSLAFLLTFLLAGAALVSALHAHLNLSGLAFRAGRAEPVFAGGEARFALQADPGGRDRPALRFSPLGRAAQPANLAGAPSAVVLAVPAPRRGRLALGPVKVETSHPLGLFRAWAYVDLGQECLVFPAPGRSLPPAAGVGEEGRGTDGPRGGRDDFTGLRAYVPGDPPAAVHWRASARGTGLVVKEFAAGAPRRIWLDWADLPAALGHEERLSALCRGALDAEQAGCVWGLRLPGFAAEPGSGPDHLRRCLAALALAP